MLIEDKQELRRCVRRCVRRAPVVETMLDFDVCGGDMGVQAMLRTWTPPAQDVRTSLRRGLAQGTPLCGGAVEMYAALDALELSARDIEHAAQVQQTYTRDAYLREVLDVMHARRVLVRVPVARVETAQWTDDRLMPLLSVGASSFVPGRYGVAYERCVQTIAQAAQAAGARHLLVEPSVDEQALRYGVMPLCEDAGLMLHIAVTDAAQADALAALLDAHTGVRALAHASAQTEERLIALSAERERLTVCLSSPAGVRRALDVLGTRFLPYASRASLPEQMLGRWILAREQIAQALCDAYLPLARSGYELTDEAIARDVEALLCGALGEGEPQA